MNESFSALLVSLWQHLPRRRRRQAPLVLFLIIAASFADAVSLGAVLSFVGALASPELFWKHATLVRWAHDVGVYRTPQLLFAMTAGFVAVSLLAGALRVLQTYANTRFAAAIGTDLSLEIYRRTIYQPYSVHISRSSNEIISGISNKISGVVSGVVSPVMAVGSGLVLLVTLLGTLLMINPGITVLSIIGFGGAYVWVTWRFRRRLRANSKVISRESTALVKAVQEGLGGIRDVILDGSQQVYCDIYEKADQPFRRALGENSFLGTSPRFVIESLAMVLIALLAYAMAREPGGVSHALPTLAALAIGAQRLLPALQQSFYAWTNISGSRAILVDTMQLLNQPMPTGSMATDIEPLTFRYTIHIDTVRFRYNSHGPWILDGLDLTIQKGERIGIIGETGSGKSTTLDLLMGLISPHSGAILIDGEPLIGNRVRAWQRSIAHVPQTIFLADSTIAENVAFGVPKAQIDIDRVKKAAERAQIVNYIESQPAGYDSMVGERGVRLSGGQRQRIGIARALYREPSVLILDEATSALDSGTESDVMKCIDQLSRDITVIMIAHRLSTLANCDRIVEMVNGRAYTRVIGGQHAGALNSAE